MDVISHGLWGGIVAGRKNTREYWLAFLIGVLPDLLSFGGLTLATFFGFGERVDWSNGPPSESTIPSYVFYFYNITHSLLICVFVLGLIFFIRKKIFSPFWAWPLHILIDIPTHSREFFATPFLWPISNYKFNGIGWSAPFIFLPNIFLLFILYVFWQITKRKKII